MASKGTVRDIFSSIQNAFSSGEQVVEDVIDKLRGVVGSGAHHGEDYVKGAYEAGTASAARASKSVKAEL